MNYKKKIYDVILDVAEELFNAYGYCAVGVDTICEKSDVSKATMYKYFSNKEGLIEQVLLRRDARFRQGLTDAVLTGNNPWQKIDAILNWHLNWFKSPEFTGCMFVAANSEFFHSNQRIRMIVHQHKQWLESLIRDCLGEQNGKQDRLARLVMIFIEGSIAYSAVFGIKDDFVEEMSTLQQLIELSY